MKYEKQILMRRIAGLKLVSIFLGVMQVLALVSAVLLPSYKIEILNSIQILIFLSFGIFFGASYLLVGENNYQFFAWTSLILGFFLYLSVMTFIHIDTGNYFVSIGSDIVPADNLIRLFILPTFMVVISTMFLRVSFVIISSIIYFFGILFYISPIVQHPKTYFTKDLYLISTDPYALNQTLLVASSQIYLFTCVAAFGLVLLLSRLTNDVALFERTNLQLGRYFSPKIREEIEKTDFDINERPKQTQMVAVLFTDLIGFTKLSENLEPSEALELLSAYQKRMVGPIFKNQGTVDKFIGDAVMATFGTPVSRGNDAQNALSCARDMQIAMREWEKERSENNLPAIKHRIGIHYGRCVVGNIGSEERMEFAVIGDTVNVAARICDACKDIGAQTLISDSVKEKLDEEITTELVADFEIRGRKERMDLHKVVI